MGSRIFKCDWCGREISRQNKKGNGELIVHHFCNNDCKGKWQTKQREDLGYTRDWLYEQYVVKRRSANDIAKEVGRNSKRVWEWIKGYGIETRGRGYGSDENLFRKGERSRFAGHKHTDEYKERARQRSLEDGRVPYLVNGKHWLKQSGKHPASWAGGVSPERQKIYASREWKDAVKEVWRREQGTCQRCGKRQKDCLAHFHLHHLYPFSAYKRLRTNPDNLALLCRDCHLFVHSKANIDHEFMLKEAHLPEWLGGK